MTKIVHFEIPAQDTGRAKEFWGSLFGVQFQTYEGPVEYHMFQNDDQTGGGIFPQQQGEKGLITYFGVEDIDAARAKVEELGGKAEDKAPVPGMGWFARAEDTEGNEFSLWQSDENAPAAEQQT
ncbi:MAG TPA: VOC family protein [Gaiellaceae bacterium]|jgi:predicted enzyme related to lactoylglutathione lyase|nr:VOC family protein [Gaiellaceae bacterium]